MVTTCNFRILVTSTVNLGALATVSGAILGPEQILQQHSYHFKFICQLHFVHVSGCVKKLEEKGYVLGMQATVSRCVVCLWELWLSFGMQ